MQDNQSQTHWIYAAAIIDSDGCLMISRSASRTNRERYDYTPRVRIAMVYGGSIDYIYSSTGLGHLRTNGVRKSRPNSLPLFAFEITKRSDVVKFLEGILPYLKIKNERAQHLLDFCQTQASKNLVGNRHYKPTADELNYRDYAYRKMRELNGNKVGATTKPQGRESVCDSLNS
jgi:hypothetical protein